MTETEQIHYLFFVENQTVCVDSLLINIRTATETEQMHCFFVEKQTVRVDSLLTVTVTEEQMSASIILFT